MAEFCGCGSLVIDNRCSNKNCSLKAAGNPASKKKTSAGAKAAVKNLKQQKHAVRKRLQESIKMHYLQPEGFRKKRA